MEPPQLDSSVRAVKDQADYYRKFHHQLMTWYITIQGFVFVGVLSYSKTNEPNAGLGRLCATFVIVTLVLFIWAIGIFSARIRKLERYGKNPPETWETDHKEDPGWRLAGVGTALFVLVCVLFALTNLGVLKAKGMIHGHHSARCDCQSLSGK